MEPESIRVDSTIPPQRYSSLLNKDVITLRVRWQSVRSSTWIFSESRPRYVLLSDMAFRITLAPPTRPIVSEWAAARDVVGNLVDDGTAAWALPMNESGGPRSSIIRKHVPGSMGSAKPKDGDDDGCLGCLPRI